MFYLFLLLLQKNTKISSFIFNLFILLKMVLLPFKPDFYDCLFYLKGKLFIFLFMAYFAGL